MTREHLPSAPPESPPMPSPTPHPALNRLESLVGTWEMTGRTLGAEEDDITGRTTIEWLPGGFFLLLHGEIDFMGHHAHSLEVVGYDPAADNFPATVYSSMDGAPAVYSWDVQGDVVTHWTAGSKYTGRFGPDGNTLVGGWRPDPGAEQTPGNTYDATMHRVA